MHILADLTRFTIAPSSKREGTVGLVALSIAILLPLVVGAPAIVKVVVPTVTFAVYGIRFVIALRREGRRGSGS
jgi:hypothetical protein